jgi:hypothetical protein
MAKASELYIFIWELITRQNLLSDAVADDAAALELAAHVWKYRKNPPSNEQLAEREREVRQGIEASLIGSGESPMEIAITLEGPESYLVPHVYEHRGERFETPARITERDVARYDCRHAGGIDSGDSRTGRLLADLQPRYVTDPYKSFRLALAEAEGRGLAAIVAPILREAQDVYESILEAARNAEANGHRQIDADVFLQYCDVVDRLLPYLPLEEKQELKSETGQTTDTKTDTPKKKTRKMNADAVNCAADYRKAKKLDESLKLKPFVNDWAETKKASAESIYRTLMDNPEQLSV